MLSERVEEESTRAASSPMTGAETDSYGRRQQAGRHGKEGAHVAPWARLLDPGRQGVQVLRQVGDLFEVVRGEYPDHPHNEPDPV